MQKNNPFFLFLRLLGLILAVFSLIPTLVYGIINVGVIGPFLAGCVLLFFPEIRSVLLKIPRCGKTIAIVFESLLVVGALYEIVMLSVLASYPKAKPDCNRPAVVLGCKVNEDGSPSLTLTARLKKAKEYLEQNPSAVCIVTGGQGTNEPISEGERMEQWLIQNGIEAERIIAETKSTDTHENMLFSSEILHQRELGTDVVVITDRFHESRACRYAEKAGLSPVGLASETPWFLQQSYWIRETAGMIKYWIVTQ